jgi:hypothetical protein
MMTWEFCSQPPRGMVGKWPKLEAPWLPGPRSNLTKSGVKVRPRQTRSEGGGQDQQRHGDGHRHHGQGPLLYACHHSNFDADTCAVVPSILPFAPIICASPPRSLAMTVAPSAGSPRSATPEAAAAAGPGTASVWSWASC